MHQGAGEEIIEISDIVSRRVEGLELKYELKERGFESYADVHGRIRMWIRKNEFNSDSTTDFS